jgi:hypothetical protein
MLVDSYRCPECDSTNISLYTEEEESGNATYGSCDDCDCYEPQNNFLFIQPKYLPNYRQWAAHEGIRHVNLSLKEDGVRFWRETSSDDTRGQLFTNVRPYFDDGIGFEWGYGGSAPARFALNILENVLREEGYHGGVYDKKTHPNFKGACFRAAWWLHQAFKEEFIVSASRDGGTIPYDVVVLWLKARIAGFTPLA